MYTENDIVTLYKKYGSIKSTARESGLSTSTVRKILIHNHIQCSERQAQIEQMLSSGKSVAQIAQTLHIKEKTVRNFMPYSRRSYAVGEKTENAQRIAASRKK